MCTTMEAGRCHDNSSCLEEWTDDWKNRTPCQVAKGEVFVAEHYRPHGVVSYGVSERCMAILPYSTPWRSRAAG